MDKDKVLEILDDLESNVQDMRENGEGDLRTVLYLIDSAYRKIKAL